jgi:hypothetical protein
MTETDRDQEEKNRKKTDRLILVGFAILILIPVILYASAEKGPERLNRLYFSGYMLMLATVFYTVRAISRSLRKQEPPILEKLLVEPKSPVVLPQQYLDLVEQVARSQRSRRYFERILLPRLSELPARRGGSPQRVERIRRLLAGAEAGFDAGRPLPRGHAAPRFRDRLRRRGVSAQTLDSITNALKEL